MHELVKKYLDEGKAKEQELLDEEARKKKEERDKYLLSLGLVASTERRYNKTYEQPFVYWDKEKKMYFYDTEIPVEVTDEELLCPGFDRGLYHLHYGSGQFCPRYAVGCGRYSAWRDHHLGGREGLRQYLEQPSRTEREQ